jgi:carbon storage regulator
MLVLTRKIGQKIRIPEMNVLIKVVEIREERVRLGIKAPESIRILRGELLGQSEAQNDANHHPVSS